MLCSLHGCATKLPNDGEWHRICVLWRISDGSLKVYGDNKLGYTHLNAFQKKVPIQGDGKFYLGAAKGPRQVPTINFRGSLNNVNIWTMPTNGSVDFDVSNCTTGQGGNFVSWKELAGVASHGIAFVNSTAC